MKTKEEKLEKLKFKIVEIASGISHIVDPTEPKFLDAIDNANWKILNCSGIKDFSGNFIFEGDLLIHDGRLNLVIFDEGCFAVQNGEDFALLTEICSDYENVLGNIHELRAQINSKIEVEDEPIDLSRDIDTEPAPLIKLIQYQYRIIPSRGFHENVKWGEIRVECGTNYFGCFQYAAEKVFREYKNKIKIARIIINLYEDMTFDVLDAGENSMVIPTKLLRR